MEDVEYRKLDKIDLRVMFWMMDYRPQLIRSWLEHIVSTYSYERRILIDLNKLYNEIIAEMPENVVVQR